MSFGGLGSTTASKTFPFFQETMHEYAVKVITTWPDYVGEGKRPITFVKNSVNTNLLIMDEVFDSSLDGFGTDDFLKIIRYIIKDANIFVISHKTGMEDKFDDVVRFEKHKGFSRKL